MPLVTLYVRVLVIKCYSMWAIISFDLIWDSVCVVDTMIYKRLVLSDKNKTEIFCVCGSG